MTTSSDPKSTVADSPPHPFHPLDFGVVGIGASAGGLQAIKLFFDNMPQDNGMAFVIILHLSPDHESIADKIIQESTQMPVLQVTETVPIERNHVYVISPAHRLTMNDGYLEVSPSDPRLGRTSAIDLFFRNLADVHRERAFCLVLSGTGSDGAVGLSRIKEQGGVTLAQAPEDAEFDGMPRAAIETQMVDLILPVVEMPQKLLELWRNAKAITLPTANDPDLQSFASVNEREAATAEQLLHSILIQLRAGTGHDFKHYKRATVLRRIERRMQVTAQPDLAAYYHYLQNSPEETKALLADMLIGVTNFFRDREAFEALERDVVPQLVSAAISAHPDKEEIRVWSAGCSTGEEVYSLAMLLSDQMQLDASQATLQLFATDIDERAISVGRSGLYPQAIITDVPPTRLRHYFSKEDLHYRIRKELREKVLFAKHSLLSDPPFSHMDLIVCRNLLIYLDREVQREILQMFHFALRPGGFLFLGTSESADACHDLFAPVDKRNRIFRAKTGAGNSRRPPAMPRGGYVRTDISQPAPQSSAPRKLSFADIHQRALEHSAPPSMIVDANADILHMSESSGRFLRHVGGELSRNLLTLIIPELRLEVRTTLFQAQQTSQVVKSRAVIIKREDRSFKVDLLAHPYRDEESDSEFVLVIFEEVEVDAADVATGIALQSENQVLSNLERELQRTKLQLQDTIEQSEVSSEELKASNEEMQAINEELRSATEELETSKEELQSINEELLTVNFELKTKVEETDKINDYLTNLIASTDIATVFVDSKLRIKWFTPRATDIFSMLPVDTGRSLLDITHRLDYEDLAGDAALVFESLNMIEREVSSTDNRWYIARILPYRSSENHIDGTVLTFIDITKRRAAEEELRMGQELMRLHDEQNQELSDIKSSNHLKDEFFAVMSHELKHPLNLIQLNAELLRRLPVIKSATPAEKAVSTICEAVSSQARIIDDLLDVARVRTGKLRLKRSAVDLNRMLQDVYQVVTNDNPDVDMSVQMPELLVIDADPTRVEQIVWNLVNNALKFTPTSGKIQLVTARVGGMARLDVRDSGVGLSAESLHQVFDLFGQAANQHATHQRDGLGIGLSLVRQLTEAHGGSVEVQSAGLGQGCTFTVLLPLRQPHDLVAPSTQTGEQSGRLAGLTVLLVDDSRDVLDTLKILLEMEDAQVIDFTEPRQALEAAQTGRYDVVVSDVGMPGMSGHDLMRALRELPHIKQVPAIALTGYGAESDIEKTRKSGFDRHLGKPVSYDALIETIEELRQIRGD
ncbi:CheR family methyltransferase [Pseudomonas nunensis]|uniref:CheR family methyltransferase n=1 Tax=Pseudomonas nunensis TaxID=2961896 RepID=UPI0025B02971|nr:CheR family methyltransferase [Pseudomonas nunensis]MDN3224740.1 CheR family methyltransferase [Pseudomonas nunensis]